MNSPSGHYKAVLYNRGCGATVGFITGISIIPSDQSVSDSDEANVVLAEYPVRKYRRDESGKIVKGKMNFDATWDSDDKLVVMFPETNFLTKRDKFEVVDIIYLPIERSEK